MTSHPPHSSVQNSKCLDGFCILQSPTPSHGVLIELPICVREVMIFLLVLLGKQRLIGLGQVGMLYDNLSFVGFFHGFMCSDSITGACKVFGKFMISLLQHFTTLIRTWWQAL